MQMKYENSRSWGTTIQSDYFHDNDQTIKPNGIGEHLSAQFNLVQYVNWFGRRGDITDDPTEILYQSFLHGALVSSLAWADMSTLWRCSFSISTKASPTLQGAPKDCLGEAVVVCDMPEPCNFPSRIACEAFSLLLRLAKSVVNIHHYPAHCMQTLPQNIHRSYQIALFCGRSSCSLTRPSKITWCSRQGSK